MTGNGQSDREATRTRVLILDDDISVAKGLRRTLGREGIDDTMIVGEVFTALRMLEDGGFDLALVDVHLPDQPDGIQLIRRARARGYEGLMAVVSIDKSLRQLFRAANAGADDYLYKGDHMVVAEEAARLLRERTGRHSGSWRPGALGKLGYLRTAGLTEKEISFLQVFASDFHSNQVLAELLGRSVEQVRKTFSRIVHKLGLENRLQLVHVLTVCGVFPSTFGED